MRMVFGAALALAVLMSGPASAVTLTFEAENLAVTNSGVGTSLQNDANTSGGHWTSLNATNTGSWMEFTLPNVPAGTYTVSMSYKTNNNRGQLSFKVDGVQVGSTLDEYAALPSVYPTRTFGTVDVAVTGDRKVRLTVTGKNSSSSSYVLSADLFTLVSSGSSTPTPTATPTGTPTSTPTATPTGATPTPTGGTPTPSPAPGDVLASQLPWVEARTIVDDTALPMIPNVNFDVTSYGAKGDGTTDNTNAFKNAISAANAAGGGRVVVPSGTYKTGAVYLKSSVDLHLNSGATLKFSSDSSKFPVVLTRYEGIECMNYSPMIYAYNEHDIALTGTGTLDAADTSSWNKGTDRAYLESLISQGVTDPHKRIVPGSGHTMRSAFVEPYRSNRVLISGVTIKNSMFWQLHPTLSTNVTVEHVSTDPSTAHSNTDGCDPESSDHVVIRNCTLGAHDDNIAIKSGRDADGRRVNVPTQNVVVYGCKMNGNWGAITVGSEITGGVRNVYAYKISVGGATKFALYVKSNTLRGGFAENINLDSVTGDFDRSFAFVTMVYNSQTGSFPPSFGPFRVTNSSSTSTPLVFDVNGLSNDHIKGLTVQNCSFNGVTTTTDKISNVDNLSFTNVKYNGNTVTR
jgi:polygalacturonase